MALLIPNYEDTPSFDAQAIGDKVDVAAELAALNGTGWISTLTAAVQHSGADMLVTCAANTALVAGRGYKTALTNVTVGGASASDRKDIIVWTIGTGFQVIAGTACGTAGWSHSSLPANPPVKPAIPANSVLYAEVYVASSTTVIVTATNITDKSPVIYRTNPAARLSARTNLR